MAIKKKKEESSIVLPSNIDQLALKAFTEQFLSSKYEDEFKATKEDLFKAIDSSSLEITIGESFKTPYGSILINETTRKKVDNDKIIDLVKSKKVTIEQILSCVSTFNNEELEKTISKSEFDKVVTLNKTQSTTLKANAEFKAKCASQFVSELKPKMDVKKELEETIELEVKVKKVSSKERLKKAMKEVDSSVDDELDAILNS